MDCECYLNLDEFEYDHGEGNQFLLQLVYWHTSYIEQEQTGSIALPVTSVPDSLLLMTLSLEIIYLALVACPVAT